MVLRHLAQIFVVGAQLVGRALSKAFQEELAASRAAAERHRSANSSNSSSSASSSWHASADSLQGITLQEAKQILNVKDIDVSQIGKNYDHLFSVNDKSKGGSLYIQSKVVRAKERLDYEISLQNRNQDNAKENETREQKD